MNNGEDIKILLVDDEDDFLAPISYWLNSHGYEATTTMSGAQMLEWIESQDFDVVLLDINMQPMDGFMCLEEIKKRKPDLTVIMLTAQHRSIREGEAKALGAEGFLYKGLEYSKVSEKIQRILSKKKSKGK